MPIRLVARQQPRSLAGGTVLDVLGDDSLFCVDPFNAVPGRRFVIDSLAEVEEAGADQERCTDQQKPSLGCEYRTLHCFLNYAANPFELADPTVLSKVCSESPNLAD